MASILELRDTALSLAQDEAERLAREAQLCLLLTIAAALGILLALGTGLLLLKLRLLSPLLANTQRLLAVTDRIVRSTTRTIRAPCSPPSPNWRRNCNRPTNCARSAMP